MLAEARNLDRLQMTELLRLDVQGKESDPHTLQFLDEQSEVLEHQPDLILASFDQLDFVPGILGAREKLQPRLRRPAAVNRNACAEFFFLLFGQRAVRLDNVRLRDLALADVMAFANSPSFVISSRPSLA